MENFVSAYVEVGEEEFQPQSTNLKIPYNISWVDFELMLKCSFGFEERNIDLKYYDEDNDAVILSSQDELTEAFKVAQNTNNTLRLNLRAAQTIEEIEEETATKLQPFIVPTLEDPSFSAQNTAPVEPSAPDGSESEDSLIMETQTESAAPEQRNTEPKVADTPAAKPAAKEQSPGQVECIDLTGVSETLDSYEYVSRDEAKSASQFFMAKNKVTGLVLDVGQGYSSNIPVTMCNEKTPQMGMSQLLYEDKMNSTIRCLLNNRCLYMGDDGVARMADFMPNNAGFQWHLDGEVIRSVSKPHVILCPIRRHAGSCVGWTRDKTDECYWIFKKVFLPGITPGSNNRPQRINFVSAAARKMDKKIAQPCKQKVKEYYNQLAKDSSRLGSKVRVMRGRRSREDSRDSMSDEMPPAWFFSYMDQFKREIADDIADLVTRRTVHQVLRGLEDNDVKTTFSRGSPFRGMVEARTTSSSSEEGTSESTNPEQAQIESEVKLQSQVSEESAAGSLSSQEGELPTHSGVICDGCEKVIIGVRYKCGNCQDFDLCEACESKGNLHNPTHLFLKIRRPMWGLGRKKNGKVVPLLKKHVINAAEAEWRLAEQSQRQKYEEMAMLKFERKMQRREEKIKRRLEGGKDMPNKREKVDGQSRMVALHMNAEFISDSSIPDGTHLQPGTKFRKSWLLRNTGSYPWTRHTRLYLLWGNIPTRRPEVTVPHLAPEEEGIVSVELLAPEEPGTYMSHWRLSHHDQRFGHRVWCRIVVDPREVLELSPDVSSNKISLLQIDVPPPEKQVEEPQETEAQPNSQSEELNSVAAELQEASQDEVKGQEAPEAEVKGQDITETEVRDQVVNPADLLNFEMLDIHERAPPKVSQTATPTNTPLDVSPPKSPSPELNEVMQALSSSSSVEIVPETPNEDMSMTELVQEKIASLGLTNFHPPSDHDDDVQSLGSYSYSGADSDSDSDFYIVPLPDCFIPDRPMSSSVTSVVVTREELRKKSVDSSARPEVRGEDCPEVIVISDDEDSINYATPDLVDDSGHASEDSDRLEDEHEGPLMVRVSVPGLEASAAIAAMVEGELNADPQAEESTGVIQIEDDDGIAHEISPGDVNGNEDEIRIDPRTDPNIVEIRRAHSEPPGGSEPESPKSPSDVAASVLSAAFGAASQAAASALSTAKDVFHTLQAQNKYVPPKSAWTPQAQKWTPPTEEWTYPQSEWTPPPTWTPPPPPPLPTHLPSNMDRLIEMGFADREQNQSLLDKHENDLEKVVQELVQGMDNEWYESRH